MGTGPPKAIAAILAEASRSSGVSARRTSMSGGGAAGGSASTIPTASGVGSSSTRPSSSSRSTRSPGVACVPTSQVQPGPPASAQDLVDLRTHLVDLRGLQAEALGDVPPGLVAAAHPEHVAVVRNALVRRRKRRVRVRVLGELDQLLVVHQ